MDNLGGIAVLVLIWIVGTIFDKKKKDERRRRQKAMQGPPPSIDPDPVSAEPRARLPDAVQRESSKLEQMLRQLNPEFAELADQALAQSRQEPVVETEPNRRSVTIRPPAEPVGAAQEGEDDFMAKAERAIARRRATAEEYARGRSAEDHAVFHEAVRRKEPEAEVILAEAPTLEQAIIWREIIGPPKAMTIDEM